MAATNRRTGRRFSVYVTAQVVGVPIALLAGWALLEAGVPLWAAAVPWLLVTVHLSRKRLPAEAVGSALHLAAAIVVLLPIAYAPEVFRRREVGAVAIARELLGPALVLLIAAAAAYVLGLLLKRRAARRLERQARADVFRTE